MREAMVAFIAARLVKAGRWRSGEAFRALSETAVRFNDSSWFWTDDNAKAAELLCDPAFFDRDPSLANDALDFVVRMSDGAVIARRGGPAELRVLSVDPAAFRVETAFFIIEGDLTRGVVRHALRFNDRRTLTAAQHTGNLVSFRHEGRGCTLDVENTITAHEVLVGEGVVTLSHCSTLRRPAGRLRGAGPVLGTLTYSYAVRVDRPSVEVNVGLEPAPGVVLEDVVVTTALDQLAAVKGMYYRAVAVRAGGADRVVRGLADGRAAVHAGAAEYVGVLQEGGSPGFAYGIHVLLRDGERLGSVLARGQRRGRLHWVLNRYALGRVSGERAGTVRVREERMVTGGGYYDVPGHYADVMRDGLGGGEVDPSMSYDIGAELNAVAVHILMARRGQYASVVDEARLERLGAWFDRHAARFFAFIRPGAADELDRVFTRGIAFVVLGLDCMLRATGEGRYRTMLGTGVRLILALQRRAGGVEVGFADTWSQGHPFLDNHAACLLALARAARHGDADGAIGRAVHRGVAAMRLHGAMVDLGGGHSEAYAGLAVLNPPGAFPHADTGFWNFKLGLVLRALHAARTAGEAGAIGMTGLEREEIGLREVVARGMLERSFWWDGAMLEVRTSRIAGETNSETQPWVALGLEPGLDDRIVGLGVGVG